jgi:hypothetical protein
MDVDGGELRIFLGVLRFVEANGRRADAETHFRVIERTRQHAPVDAVAQVYLLRGAELVKDLVYPAYVFRVLRRLARLRGGVRGGQGKSERDNQGRAHGCQNRRKPVAIT